MRIFALLTAASFALMLLAGCLGGEDDLGADNGESQQSSQAEVTEQTGAVRGTVSSDLFEPLGGARVELLTQDRASTDHTATVDPEGEFAISRVDPGQYIVFVTAVGYESGQRSVEIVAGEIATAQFQLEALPHDGPFMETWDVTGFIDWAASWQAEAPGEGCVEIDGTSGLGKTCGGVRSGFSENGEIRFGPSQSVDGWEGNGDEFFEADMEDVKTILVEMTWTPAGPLGENLQLDLMCQDMPRGANGAVEETDHPCYFDTPSRESPIIHRVDEEHWLEAGYDHTGTWATRIFATYGLLGTHDLTGVDAGVAYQQDFDIVISLFHGEPAEQGVSMLPDA